MAQDAASYGENHAFAVAFTCVAAASQGLGGLLAVLGMGEFGSSVAHLMSFSTGVMIYLSFMDIMVETKEKIGEDWSGVAFFIGIGLFLLLEVGLPEADGAQVAELLGMAWTPSSPAKSTADAPACGAAGSGGSGGETAQTQQPEQSSSQLRRRGAAAGGSSSEAPAASAPTRRASVSPARSRRTATPESPPSSPPRSAVIATRRAPPSSPQVPQP